MKVYNKESGLIRIILMNYLEESEKFELVKEACTKKLQTYTYFRLVMITQSNKKEHKD